MHKIYINRQSKCELIDLIITHKTIPLEVILHKKYVKVLSLLKNIQLLPNVLVDIINEYNADVMNALVIFDNNDGGTFCLSIKYNDNVWFSGKLYQSFRSNRWYIKTNYDILKLYFNNVDEHIYLTECVPIFNLIMKCYYGKRKYIKDGTWVQHYIFLNNYLSDLHNNSCKYDIRLENVRILKNIIVVVKVLTSIINKYYEKN